ncbi:Wall-associated receptor kinase 2 [Carex littledalei]|uniref:Wall-associated receptor kinase 2 n=1 Tax=Carex littledalei TaxID=544730 RepID=A0A833RED2_9POAL|nr:Wall-associated receptor kinase 2 [Carex littledalei]
MIALPGCPKSYEGSDIQIPYPFGIGRNCSLSEEFVVNCENTTDGMPSPYRGSLLIENIDNYGQASTRLAIASSCGSTPTTTNFSNITPFRLNTELNKFVVVGCNTLAYLHLDNSSDYLAGCFSSCGRYSHENFCSGIGCCQTDIPKGTSTFYATSDERLINNYKVHDSSRCSYAMVVEADAFNYYHYNSTIDELAKSKVPANRTMPILLDWAIGNTTCEGAQTNKSSYILTNVPPTKIHAPSMESVTIFKELIGAVILLDGVIMMTSKDVISTGH